MKSTLKCDTCGKESVNFELFSNIALPLPEPSKVTMSVVVYRLPSDIKDMLKGKTMQLLKRMSSARSEQEFHAGKGSISQPEGGNFQESFKQMINDQPIQVMLRVDKDIKISELARQIAEIKEVNVDPISPAVNLVLFSMGRGQVRGIFNPENILTQYNLLTYEITAIEILTNEGREQVKDFYRKNPTIQY